MKYNFNCYEDKKENCYIYELVDKNNKKVSMKISIPEFISIEPDELETYFYNCQNMLIEEYNCIYGDYHE